MHNLPSESFNHLLIDTCMFSYFSDANRFSSAFFDKVREILSIFPFWCNYISVKVATEAFIQNTLRHLKAQFFNDGLSLADALL